MKLKKNIILSMVLLFFLAGNVPGQGQWEWLNPKPQGNSLYDVVRVPGTNKIIAAGGYSLIISYDQGDHWEINHHNIVYYSLYFTDSDTGYATTSQGVLRTTDSGETWQTYEMDGYETRVQSLYFFNDQVAVAGGEDNLIIKTSDGGQTWQTIPPVTFWSTCRQLLFPHPLTGYMIGDFDRLTSLVLKTTDQGDTWTPLDIGWNIMDHVGHFFDKDTGLIMGRTYGYGSEAPGRIMLKTFNGGANWETIVLDNQFPSRENASAEFRDLHFFNRDTGLVCGDLGIFKTENGGNTWAPVCQVSRIVALEFKTDQIGWAVGDTGAIFRTTDGGDTWEPLYSDIFINSSSKYQNLQSVSFVDRDTGYVISYDGTLIKTRDGGENWEHMNFDEYGMKSITFLNSQTGFAAGNQGLFKTVDGGISWIHPYQSIEAYLTAIHFPSESCGYLAGYQWSHLGNITSLIYKTSDRGDTWQQIYPGSALILYDIHFPNTITGYAVGDSDSLIKTTDGGFSWECLPVNVPQPGFGLFSVFFTDSLTGYVGTQFSIEKTTDGGHTWASTFFDNYASINRIQFISPDTGFALRSGYCDILKTTDAGETWHPEYSKQGRLADIHFPDKHTGYAVGNMGAILKYTDTSSPVKPLPDRPKMPVRTALYPNFPNPFNNTTVLKFDLPENTRVSLIIYTVTGQEVARVVDGPMPAGKHAVKFDAQTLPSGLYLARLQTGKQAHTRRILLLK